VSTASVSQPVVIIGDMGTAFTISCEDCVARESDACSDCVVTFICGREPDDAVIIDAEEERAVRLLARAGLVPGLRHERRTS
jgi:hypothetical protein